MFQAEEIYFWGKSFSAADTFFKHGPKAVLADFRLATYCHLISFSPYTIPYLKQPNIISHIAICFFNLLFSPSLTHTYVVTQSHAPPVSFRRACNLPLASAADVAWSTVGSGVLWKGVVLNVNSASGIWAVIGAASQHDLVALLLEFFERDS